MFLQAVTDVLLKMSHEQKVHDGMRNNLDKPKIVAIVPARGDSKSVKGKNVKALGDHPLIAYTLACAMQSEVIEDVVVTTDSQHIADVARAHGANVPFLRPREISGDNSTDLEFFQHYIVFCEGAYGEAPEYLVHLRPTTPFRDFRKVDVAIRNFIEDETATALRSVHRSKLTPYKIFQMVNGYMTGFFPEHPISEYYNLPRQTFPEAFVPNGYVDIVRTSVIKTGVLHGNRMVPLITEKVPDIDILEDFHFAENMLRSMKFEALLRYMKENYVGLS